MVATSVPNDCTRGPWGGGTKTAPVFTVGHVTPRFSWVGLATYCAPVPNPPPTWPTITSEVGTVLPPANVRLLVRLTVRFWPKGTVITTGDQQIGRASCRERV